MTHTIKPDIPVWSGFGPATFAPAISKHRRRTRSPTRRTGSRRPATSCRPTSSARSSTRRAHWAPEYAAIDELPPTFAVRPLVVISIVPQVKKNFNYQMTVADIHKWEKRYGRIPAGSVVMIRSDWSKRWPDPALATLTEFPGVKLAALKFLHHKRHILFHGHEPLDTDSTPTLEGEFWLMHHGYAQAEGVDNLSQVKPKGCLIEIGYPKFGGGLRRLRPLHRDLPAELEARRQRRPAAGVAAAQVQQRPAVGHERWGCGTRP